MSGEKKDVVIEAAENGPIIVKVGDDIRCALCRCGGSNSKPYCDGSHAKIKFKAAKAEVTIV